MRECTKCHTYMHDDNFYRDKQKRDNLTSWCKICIDKRSKKWKQDNPEARTRSFWNQAKKFPEKYYAKYTTGKIPITSPCTRCNTNISLQRHHPDYSKPREFIVLCVKCHNAVHKELRNVK